MHAEALGVGRNLDRNSREKAWFKLVYDRIDIFEVECLVFQQGVRDLFRARYVSERIRRAR